MKARIASRRPIGVFDSGVGGLTVLRALRQRLPGESFLYLGDTARLPYGTKSAGTVQRYALNAARHLVGDRMIAPSLLGQRDEEGAGGGPDLGFPVEAGKGALVRA